MTKTWNYGEGDEAAMPRQFSAAIPILWRPRETVEWIDAVSVSLSSSAVLFHSDRPADAGTSIDLMLVMGYDDDSTAGMADVLCTGRIVSVQHDATSQGRHALSSTIESFTLLRSPHLTRGVG